jgi:hypothetical protein
VSNNKLTVSLSILLIFRPKTALSISNGSKERFIRGFLYVCLVVPIEVYWASQREMFRIYCSEQKERIAVACPLKMKNDNPALSVMAIGGHVTNDQ